MQFPQFRNFRYNSDCFSAGVFDSNFPRWLSSKEFFNKTKANIHLYSYMNPVPRGTHLENEIRFDDGFFCQDFITVVCGFERLDITDKWGVVESEAALFCVNDRFGF